MNMIEHLIEKGVKKHFNGQIVLFEVASLNEHFEGLQIHDTDIVKIEQWENNELIGAEEFIKASDVNFDGAVAKEVAPAVEDSAEGETIAPEIGMPYEEAEKLVKLGGLIALPEWKGFWFVDLRTIDREILVFTKEGEITDTPHEEYKERNDWIVVEATPEQEKILDDYFASVKKPEGVVELTQEEADTLIKAENAKIAEIKTIDAVEVTADVVPELAKTTKAKKS